MASSLRFLLKMCPNIPFFRDQTLRDNGNRTLTFRDNVLYFSRYMITQWLCFLSKNKIHKLWALSMCGSAGSRDQLKCDDTREETRFLLSAKRMSPFKSAGTSVQSTTGSRGVRIGGINAAYTIFWGSVKGTGCPLYSPVSPLLPLPCVNVCHHISTGAYPLIRYRVSHGGTCTLCSEMPSKEKCTYTCVTKEYQDMIARQKLYERLFRSTLLSRHETTVSSKCSNVRLNVSIVLYQAEWQVDKRMDIWSGQDERFELWDWTGNAWIAGRHYSGSRGARIHYRTQNTDTPSTIGIRSYHTSHDRATWQSRVPKKLAK